MSSPDIAVIIVTYHRPKAVVRLVDSLISQDLARERYEVCIVDNGGDGPKEALASRVDHWVTAHTNLGASAGRNCGVRLTGAPVLVFLDDDGVLEQGSLSYVLACFEREPHLMGIRGRILPLEHPLFSSMAKHYSRGLSICDELLIIEGATAMSRPQYEAVEGYREGLFGNEGLELSERLLTAFPDKKIEYHPSFVLRHDFVSSWHELWKKAQRMVETTHSVSNETGLDVTMTRALARYKNYRFIDDRSTYKRTTGWAIKRAYLLFMAAHRVLKWMKK
ncbi:MAG: glycosyltransferase [Myxococcota bacterium]|nr:glycosyltransferase [Myxococcota bacterium]